MVSKKADTPERFDFNAEPWTVAPDSQNDLPRRAPFGYFTEERDFAAAVDFAAQMAQKVGHKLQADGDFLNEIRAIQMRAVKAALNDFFYKRALKSLENHTAANDFCNAWTTHQRRQGKAPDPVKQWEGFI